MNPSNISYLLSSYLLLIIHVTYGQKEVQTLNQKKIYLPDFSYAGYHNGLKNLPENEGQVFLAQDFGVIPDDGKDDTEALKKAIDNISKQNGKVIIQLPPGRIIISDIIYLERSNLVLRGAGSGKKGTEIFCPRPLQYVHNPKALEELREYLVKFDKRQREKENNINLPFSQYAWSGGFLWTQVPYERVKSYLKSYDKPFTVLAKVERGTRGDFKIKVNEIENIKPGDVVELQIFNKEGENSLLIKDLYKEEDVKVGSHHWEFPNLALVKQQVEIKAINGNILTLNSPLSIDINPEYQVRLVEWKHLKEVGIEHMRINFPSSPRVAHHVEPGYNAIYLTRLYNSWVKDVVIDNADSGIITEDIANVTIKDITTQGENYSHYTVMMQATYNVLADGIRVLNKAVHPLSFNTFATRSVYTNCEVFVDPILDQHSGANHQNLFDNIKVYASLKKERAYPLFKGGGAGYWKPSHGAYNTFWNIKVNFLDGLDKETPILLNGMEDGVFARLIGVHANHEVLIEYEPKAIISFTNQIPEIESLYYFQLNNRASK